MRYLRIKNAFATAAAFGLAVSATFAQPPAETQRPGWGAGRSDAAPRERPGRPGPMGDFAGQEQRGPQANPMQHEIFAADVDGDGALTLDEFQNAMNKTYQRLDRNADQKLDRRELRAFAAPADGAPGNRMGVAGPGAGRGFGAQAGSDGPRRGGERILQNHDADGDGRVSAEEFPGAPERFKNLDGDGDGVLTLEEMQAFPRLQGAGAGAGGRGPRMGARQETGRQGAGRRGAPEMLRRVGERMLQNHDANGDGRVTADEFPGAPERFKNLDANDDGAVDAEELDQAIAQRRRQADGQGARQGVGPQGARRGAADVGEAVRRRLHAMDADQDQRVSREEFTGPAERFDLLDRNDDGFLDAEDRPVDRPRDGRGGGEGFGGGRKAQTP